MPRRLPGFRLFYTETAPACCPRRGSARPSEKSSVGFSRADPVRLDRWEPLEHPLNQQARQVLAADGGQVRRPDEPLVCRVMEQLEERVEEAVDVEKPASFSMEAKLGPGDHFAQF